MKTALSLFIFLSTTPSLRKQSTLIRWHVNCGRNVVVKGGRNRLHYVIKTGVTLELCPKPGAAEGPPPTKTKSDNFRGAESMNSSESELAPADKFVTGSNTSMSVSF